MRFTKRLLGTLLCGSVLASLICVPAFADDVQTASADTVMLSTSFYDYEKSTSYGQQYLLFGQEQRKDSGSYNAWSAAEDWRISQGLVADELDADGNLQLGEKTVNGKAVQLTVPDTKSGKLFDEGELVGTYQMPFTYDSAKNRYVYDSNTYKMMINYDTQVLECSEYASGEKKRFVPLSSSYINYYFGMATSLPFVYTGDGKVNGEDMVFEFAGDDDIWVFVDGKLALDLGGIHNAVSGSINFRTGEVKTVGKIKDNEGRNSVTMTKLDSFDRSVKNHTLKVFYLERGAFESNFKLSFNLQQPTNYIVKYYDGKYYDGKTGDKGLLATVVQHTRADGTPLYAGDKILQNEIKINVNKATADLIASDDYYGGFVVDEDFKSIDDPNAVVSVVTEDDTDIVYVVFLPKPSYTVTYWLKEDGNLTQITQKVFTGKKGQQITADDTDLSLTFDGYVYKNGTITSEADANGVYGTLNYDAPFNVDVVYTVKKDAADEPEDNKTLENSFAYIFGRDDYNMEADDYMHRDEACAVLYRLKKQNDNLGGFTYKRSATPKFANLTGAWARSAIEFMVYLGVYDADPSADFDLNSGILRGEAFKLFAMNLGFTEDNSLTYEDYAHMLYRKGFIQGDENGNLNIYDMITRAEFCTIYNKIIGRDGLGLKTADGTEVTAETYGFTDLSQSNWYYDIILKATSAYDNNGYVSIEKRGIRNQLDDYSK